MLRTLKDIRAHRLSVSLDASHRGSSIDYCRLPSSPHIDKQIQVTQYEVYGQQYYDSNTCDESIPSHSCSNSYISLKCWYVPYPPCSLFTAVPSMVLRVWRCQLGCSCHGIARHGYGKQRLVLVYHTNTWHLVSGSFHAVGTDLCFYWLTYGR